MVTGTPEDKRRTKDGGLNMLKGSGGCEEERFPKRSDP